MHKFELVFRAILLTMTSMCVVVVEASEQDLSLDRIVYDQRQSGKYNIHVSIKDVAIIEMDQNEIENQPSNEDYYYYDDNDLTVKPIKLPVTTASLPSSSPPTTTMHREVETEASTLPTKLTFSQNLLADIAATHASNYPEPQTSTTLKTTKATNVVIVESNSEHNSPTSTHLPQIQTPTHQTFPAINNNNNNPIVTASKTMPMSFLSGRTKDIPIRAVNEPNSRIVKVKVQRNHQQQHLTPTIGGSLADRKQQTQTGQQHETTGNWGGIAQKRKRSSPASSILRKIFGMLVSLPFASERGHHQHHHIAAAADQYQQTKH